MNINNKIIFNSLLACRTAYSIEWNKDKLGFDSVTFYSKNDIEFLIGSKDGISYIAFQGSKDRSDWIYDFTFFFSKRSIYGTNKKLKMHKGFIDAYRSIENYILPLLAKIKEPLIICGHSFGGAMALHCALEYSMMKKPFYVITYGSPRIGNEDFKNHFRKFVTNIIEFKVNNDVVCNIPFKWMGYEDMTPLTNIHYSRPKDEEAFLNGWTPFGNWADHKLAVYEPALKQYLNI